MVVSEYPGKGFQLLVFSASFELEAFEKIRSYFGDMISLFI